MDSDGDGVFDLLDAFPNDPKEWEDTDGDAVGNNADPDDDNDGMPDTWEIQYSLNPLDATDGAADKDADGVTNLGEYQQGSDPNTPDSKLAFVEQQGVQPATVIESNIIRLYVLTGTTTLSITGGEYRKNVGAYTKARGTVQNGDTVQVRHTASSKSKTAGTTTLKLGKQALAFKSTTLVIDSVSDAFSCTALTGVARNTLVEATTVTLSGINVPVAISISGGEYRINGGTYTIAKGRRCLAGAAFEFQECEEDRDDHTDGRKNQSDIQKHNKLSDDPARDV